MKKTLIFIAVAACISLFGYIKAEQGDYDTLGFNTVGGYSWWRVATGGALVPGVASSIDIGSATLPVRTVYAGSISGASIASGGAVSGTTGAFSAAVTGLSLTATGGAVKLYSRTQAQIEAIVPGAAGAVYYCSDCTVTTVCVSTSATALSWVSVGALATACD